MPPAIIGGAIAAAGTIGGAVLGSSAQKKAAKQANAAQQDATQAQLTLGRESMALNRDIYNQNKDILNPFVQRGNVAGEAINALLGLPPPAPAPATPGGTPQTNPVSAQEPVTVGQGPGTGGPVLPNGLLRGFQAARGEQDASVTLANLNALRAARGLPPFANDLGTPAPVTGAAPTSTPTSTVPTPATPGVSPQEQAFRNFADSAGMRFQLEQGENAINQGYAAHGQLQSGAALKALQNYGQSTALNNYLMPYMGLLGGQQATGAGAASSVAGVGQNFGNTAAAINAGMGSSIQSGANAASNAALLRGQANSNMWGGIASGLGGLASSFGGGGGGGFGAGVGAAGLGFGGF